VEEGGRGSGPLLLIAVWAYLSHFQGISEGWTSGQGAIL
jgi:hypothetical protein